MLKTIKVVPLFGVSPVFHRIHHKDNMDKLLAICAIGIAPTDNDLRKGGRGQDQRTHTSVSKMMMGRGATHAKKGNLLRKKGESYFENWEICGS